MQETKNTKNVSWCKLFLYICSVDEKLKNILDTMCDIYRKYGIKSITMNDAARENGISKKTLYKYVSDKADLVKSTTRYGFEKHISQMNAISKSSNSAIEDFFELYKVIGIIMAEYNPAIDYDMAKYYPQIFKEMQATKSKMVYDFTFQNLEKGIKSGVYIADLDKILIAKQQALLISSTIDNKVVSYKDFLNKAAVITRFTYHLRAICNTKGLKILEQKLNELKILSK